MMKLEHSKKQNEKLVDILNHKMFKGYRQIKNSKTFGLKRFKFIQIRKWENEPLEPFEENYNLQYQRTYLNKGPTIDCLITQNTNDNTNNKSKFTTSTTTKNNFFITYDNNEKTFYNIPLEDQTKKRIYKQIFPYDFEVDKYNNIPLLPLQRKRKDKNESGKPVINNDNDDDEYNGLTGTQFLYRISHKQHSHKNLEVLNFKQNKGLYKGFVSRKMKEKSQDENKGYKSSKSSAVDVKEKAIQTETNSQYKKGYRTVRKSKEIENYTGYTTNYTTQGNNSNYRKKKRMNTIEGGNKGVEYQRYMTNKDFIDMRNRNREKFSQLKIIMNGSGDNDENAYLQNLAYLNIKEQFKKKPRAIYSAM